MGGIPLAALAINQNQPGPLEQVGKALQLKALQQNQQYQAQAQPLELQQKQLANQQQQYQFAAQQAMNKAYQGAVTVDENGQPKFDEAALTKHLSDAGFGSEVPTVLEHMTKFQEAKATLAKTHSETAKLQGELQSQQQDMMGNAGAAIQAAKYDPSTADTILQHLEMTPNMPPEGKQRIDQMRQQMSQNPAILKQAADTWVAQSPAQQKIASERMTAEARKASAETSAAHLQAEMPGGPLNKVAQETAIATNPQIQAGKIRVAAAEGAARAEVAERIARGSNAALAEVPQHLIAPATADATKAGQDYAQAKSVSDRLGAVMDAARRGNVVSYQLLPQEGALQLTTSQGVHRINMAEIQNYGGGSLWQKMQGHIGKALTGKSIPESVLNDMAEMQKFMAEGSQSKYENSLKTINQNYGSKFKPVEMETMKEAPASAPQHTPGGAAQGLKEGQTGKGSDGKPYVVKGGIWVPMTQ